MQAASAIAKGVGIVVGLIILVPIVLGIYFMIPKSGSILAANCDEKIITVKWLYQETLSIETGPKAHMQLFYSRGGKELPLTRVMLGPLPGGDYSPLPFNTSIETQVIDSSDPYTGNGQPVAIFVNPLDFSSQEFEQLSQCVLSNNTQIVAALGKGAKKISGPNIDNSDFKIVGLARISVAELQNKIHTANPNGAFTYKSRDSVGDTNGTVVNDDGSFSGPDTQGGDIFRSSSYAYMLSGDGTELGGSHYDYSFNSDGESVPQYLKKLREKLGIKLQ